MGKWFPNFYDVAMKPLEATRFKKVRTEMVKTAAGRVLEIGSGTGINFPYYLHATEVVAIEPNPKMSIRGVKRMKKAYVPIKLYEVSAEALPFDDDTFDTVVATLVFCTIPDPVKALAEIQRVSRPGATLLFFEHVRMNQPILGKTQDVLNPLWNKLCDGCHLNRDTLALLKASGIQVTTIDTLYAKLFLSITCLNSK